MNKSLKNNQKKINKFLKRRLSFLIASPLAVAITSLVLIGSASAAVVTYQVVVNSPEEKAVRLQDNKTSDVSKDTPKTESTDKSAEEPPADPNHQDLSPGQNTNTNIKRDTRYGNVHDMSQDTMPTCSDGWQYIASNGDFVCMQNSCNYAFLTRVKEGVDETTLGLSRGVRGGVGCHPGPTAADVWAGNNVACEDGTQNCITSTIVDVGRNPNYTPPNGQE